MAGVMNPGRRTSGTLLDYVLKGVQVAADVYGVNQKNDSLDLQREELEQTKGLKQSALQQATAKDSALATARQTELDRRAKADADKLAYTKENDIANRKLKERELAQGAANAAAKTVKTTADKSSLEGRLSGLNGEERKRLDSSAQGLNAVQNMASALKAGDWTVNPIGDNNYTLARTNYVEAIGRMQSGGAINNEEAEKFRSLAPGPLDSAEMQQTKLKEAYTEMALRMKSLGFTPEEMIAERSGVKVPDSIGLKPDMSGTATATAPAKGKVWVSNGKETLEINESDLDNAKKDGYLPAAGASGSWK